MRRALLSVSDKSGLLDFARGLQELERRARVHRRHRPRAGPGGHPGPPDRGLHRLSRRSWTAASRRCTRRLYAGLLARRDEDSHLQAAEEQGIEPVDLVCVNLYPFEQTLARGDASEQEIIENIDIGGPTMIRAAAKNSAFAAVVVDPERLPRGAGRSCARATGACRPPPARSSPARRSPAPPATTPPSPGGSRAPPRGLPPELERGLREGPRPALRREPPPAGRLLLPRRRRPPPARGRQPAARQGAVVQQPARPQLRPRTGRRLRASPPARSSSTTTPAAARSPTAPRRPTRAPSRATPRAPTAG